MNREYHKWYSPHLGREMEFLLFGHAGRPILVFPTSMGRYFQNEFGRTVLLGFLRQRYARPEDLRRDFPAVGFLSESPALKLLRFVNERAVIPGLSAIEDPAPLTSSFWRIRAQRSARAALEAGK